MERALEGDDPVALRMALRGMVFPRHLDRALERLGARIAEGEDGVGEGRLDQLAGQPVAFRDP